MSRDTSGGSNALEARNASRRVARRRASPLDARTAVVVIALAAVAVLAAACGDNPSSSGTAGLSDTGGSNLPATSSAKALAFARCMRARGVPNFPDPNSAGGFNKAALHQLADSNARYQAATHGCQHLLPSPTATQQRLAAVKALQFSRCMRTHGVSNFPDPGSDGQIPDPATFGINQGSPRFQAANQACGGFRPPYIPSNAAYNAYAKANAS